MHGKHFESMGSGSAAAIVALSICPSAFVPVHSHRAAAQMQDGGYPGSLPRLSALGQLIRSGSSALRKVMGERGTPATPADPFDADGRATRRQLRELLSPRRPGLFSLWERRAIAAFAATLAGDAETLIHCRRLLAEESQNFGELSDMAMSGGDPAAAVLAEARRVAQSQFTPAGQAVGKAARYRVPAGLRDRLGDRLAAGLEYAWSLLAGPDQVGHDDHRRLTRNGWAPAEIAQLTSLLDLLRPEDPRRSDWPGNASARTDEGEFGLGHRSGRLSSF